MGQKRLANSCSFWVHGDIMCDRIKGSLDKTQSITLIIQGVFFLLILCCMFFCFILVITHDFNFGSITFTIEILLLFKKIIHCICYFFLDIMLLAIILCVLVVYMTMVVATTPTIITQNTELEAAIAVAPQVNQLTNVE